MMPIIKSLNRIVRKGQDCQDFEWKNKYASKDHTHDEYIVDGQVLENVSIGDSGGDVIRLSPVDHNHDTVYLLRSQPATNSNRVEKLAGVSFALKGHAHEEYELK